ncbi:MAG: S9 family peptidase [Nannocystaceae bacterium]|nr:S9 family peptidase [Nannocystaceae bacterium]
MAVRVAAWLGVLVAGCVRAAQPAAPAHDREPAPSIATRDELIPRALLFGNPERTRALVSPDGQWISWLAPSDGVMNLWTAPAHDLASARVLTHAKQPLTSVQWAFDGRHLLYGLDTDGDELFHVYRVAVDTGEVVDLTPSRGAIAAVLELSPQKPDTVLVVINDRDPAWFDVHAIVLASGERRLVAKNDQGFAAWIADRNLDVRFGLEMTDDGGIQWMERRGRGWRRYDVTPPQDTDGSDLLAFAEDSRSYYAFDSRGRDTAALFRVDTRTKKKQLLFADARVDLGGLQHPWLGHDARVLLHPTEGTVQAVVVDHELPRWVVLDPAVAPDFAALADLDRGVFNVTSRTLDDQTWIVAFESDVRSRRYWRWDRATQTGELLFAERPRLDRHALVPMHALTIAARDGLQLVSYLSLPRAADRDGDGRPESPVPMVLFPHGGPWVRDHWGFRDLHQLFADRGYAVLAVNYRGSAGFGKAFSRAGDLQWGKRMQDDLLDAVKWTVEQRIADPERICIAGWSWGGYATLVGLTQTPELFACGVAGAAPTNLVTTIEGFPPSWYATIARFYQRVGDPRTPTGRQALLDVSPLTHVANIRRPLLIAHGARDARATRSEPDQIVAAMKAEHIPVGYVVLPDEGHDAMFWRPANFQALLAVVEAFLAANLGGAYQPIDAAELAASSLVIEAGRDQLPGLPKSR